MQAEPVDVYCPRCDSAYSYFPEVPEHCWNCGASFLDLSSRHAQKPTDHFPVKPGLLATLGIVGGIAISAWEHHTNNNKWLV